MSADAPAVEVPPQVVEYLDSQNTMTLATVASNGVPRASTFLYVNEGPILYFWTRGGTTTARHLEQNPVVSFAIDEYASDLRQTRGVQGTGECNVVLSGEEVARVADLFGQKFPSLSPGNTLSISFYRISPTELDFIDNTGGSSQTAEGAFGAEFHRERAYSVFRDLPTQDVEVIAGALQTIEASEGEVIVRQGGPADKFFIVVDGQLEVVREQNGGSEQIALLGKGQFFGELAIMRGSSRTATVKATEATTLLAIDRDTFRDLVARSLGTTIDFEQVIKARLSALAGDS
jgi:uncharacterized protein YhbP (UPF0306 family)